MTTPLRKLLEDAEAQVSVYKNPQITEAQAALEELLGAADLGHLDACEITYLHVGSHQTTVMGRHPEGADEREVRFDFPTWLIDKEEPLTAARSWGIGQKLLEAERKIEYLRDQIIVQEAVAEKQRAKLRLILDGRGDEL